jgi:hypothetical protein
MRCFFSGGSQSKNKQERVPMREANKPDDEDGNNLLVNFLTSFPNVFQETPSPNLHATVKLFL